MCEKHMKQESKDVPTLGRRSVLGRIWAGLVALAILEGGWLISLILRAKRKEGAASNSVRIIDVGELTQFIPGQVTAVPQGRFFLSCLEDGRLIALSRTCTHLGCTLPWDVEKKKFICPCHGSTFDERGEVLTAPAVRPLDYYPVKIENGMIKVDVSTPMKRETFDLSQTARV